MSAEIKNITDLSESEITEVENSELVREARSIWKYGLGMIQYYLEYHQNPADLSFVLFEAGQPRGFALMYGCDNISFFGMPIEVFLTGGPISKKTVSRLIAHLKEIAKGQKIHVYYDELLAYQIFKDTDCELTISTELSYSVSLDKPLDEIKRSVRRRYKSMINWGMKNVEYQVIDSNNAELDKFHRLKDFHLQIAGRKTRSDQSWSLQYAMIERDEAFLINGYLEGKLISSSFFQKAKISHYGVGVYDKDLMATNKGIAHGSMYKAIEYLHEHGMEKLLLAEWLTEEEHSEKQEQILDFKRGFTDTIASRNIMNIKVK